MAIRANSTRLKRRNSGNAVGSIILAAGVVASALIITSSRKPTVKIEAPAPVVAEFDTVRLPVPVEPVPAGVKVRDIKFKTVAFPRHQVPENALGTIENYGDSVTMAPLPANLPLFAGNFSSQTVNNPVLERIPEGMRAMTIRVDATTAVEGWAGSGSVVDVLLVEKDRTSVVAEKVKILSAERSVSPVEGSAAPSIPSTVTLLVTQEQCLAINTAVPLGRIAFALRSARDEQSWSDGSYTADRLKGGPVEDKSQKKETISGYIKVRGADGNNSVFALVGNQWVKSEAEPRSVVAEAISGN